MNKHEFFSRQDIGGLDDEVLRQALASNNIRNKVTLEDAIKRLFIELRGDKDYFRAWKDNIAMAFYDEVCMNPALHMDENNWKEISNKAAENFLNLLIKGTKDPSSEDLAFPPLWVKDPEKLLKLAPSPIKEKYYFGDKIPEAKEGDIIYFEMPPFCSGEYTAKIYKDEYGLYINKEDNFFSGCRDYYILNKS